MPIPGQPFEETTNKMGLPCYVIPEGDFVVVKQHMDERDACVDQFATPTAGGWRDNIMKAHSYTEEAAHTYANMIGEGAFVCNKNELIANYKELGKLQEPVLYDISVETTPENKIYHIHYGNKLIGEIVKSDAWDYVTCHINGEITQADCLCSAAIYIINEHKADNNVSS